MKSLRNYLICLLLIALTSSCETTKSLWESSYDEHFRAFLIANNGHGALLLGEKYNYEFDDYFGDLDRLLESPLLNSLFIDIDRSYIKLDHKNNIVGYLTLNILPDKLSRYDYDFLTSLGFRNSKDDILFLTLQMTGRRYSNRIEPSGYILVLNHDYILPIHYEPSLAKDGVKVILTPLTLLVDLVRNVGEYILLVPFRE